MVLVICGVFAVISEGFGKGPFAQNYTINSPEGSLVSYQGIIQKVTVTSTGGNTILDMGAVQLFIPASVGAIDVVAGDTIQVYGTIQIWKGKREILVKNSKDIRSWSDLKREISVSNGVG
ncbi:MAG: hypothetical protein LUQ50_03375 [Methanospirillum sp.]|uniref:hypothetical protein n=1 Tax=Methanospirillum sp. TaxID=45200 RepID=UPI00236CA88E|nr:hypothetical protein [Methanospirillum sp.]MDD1728096.1 hypothetical protein [Methanospirillum sp.]